MPCSPAASTIDASLTRETLATFIERTLNERLWNTQRDICDAIDAHRFVAVRSCHAAGKSHIAARVALAYLHTHENSIVVTTAPTNRQVKNVLWRYINGVAARNEDRLRGRALQTEYEISPNWYAIAFKGTSENSDAFQGFHAEHIFLIVDEAAGVPEAVFDAADAILTGESASCLLISNPTSSSGTFREAFHRSRDLWYGVKISAYDTPNFTAFGITRTDMVDGTWRQKVNGAKMPYPSLIDPQWVARHFRRHGPHSPFVQSRIDADFPEEGDDTLIPLSALEKINTQAGDPEIAATLHTKYELGVDVARYGSDETSICLRRGPEVRWQKSWAKSGLMETVGKIRHHLEHAGLDKGEVTIKVDVIGMGSGVADRLRELGYTVVEVNVAAASSDKEKWSNLRHELWWQLRERILEGDMAPLPGRQLDEIAVAQMSDVKYTYRSTHTMPVIETKEEAARRGATSPDRAEAIMLAFAKLPNTGVPGFVRVGRSKGRW